MIDLDTLDSDHPALARALGGGTAARAAVADLVSLLRRAGVDVPGFPAQPAPEIASVATNEAEPLGPETELTRSEFFHVLTGTTPERLEE